MRVVCISDTHNKHREIKLPAGDILIHCGDATMSGEIGEMEKFAEWFNRQSCFDHRIFVPGNHDFCAERDYYARAPYLMNELFTTQGTHYLVDKGVELEGLKFYGSPWVPNLTRWAFYGPPAKLEEKFALIPNDVDVLITHGPPHGVMDLIPEALLIGRPNSDDEAEMDDGLHVGSMALLNRTMELDYNLHCFGHIHESYGQQGRSVNASICDERYKAINAPIIVDI